MELLYERFFNILKEAIKTRPVDVLFIGRSAMPFYGIKTSTVDLDFEIQGISEQEFYQLKELLDRNHLIADFSEDVSRWSLIPLPEDYRERARVVYEREGIRFKVLDPVDFVISKLRRGTVEDEEDSMAVIQVFGITEEDIRERIKMVTIPKDLESLFFMKRIERFLSSLKGH